MQIVLDFIEGKVSYDDFLDEWNRNPEIGLWLDQLIDLRAEPKPEWKALPHPGTRIAIHKYFNGSFLAYFNNNQNPVTQYKHPKCLEVNSVFTAIVAIVVVAYPNIVPTTIYNDEYDFYCDTIGDTLGGPEVDSLIEELLARFPRSMGKTKRKKEAKAAIRELFHLEGNRRPRWAQEPEWPMGLHSPMAYVSQKRDGDLVCFTFRDVDTGEVRIVEQFY